MQLLFSLASGGFGVFFLQLLSESFGNITDVSGPSSGEALSVI